jgi:RNA methyltransferase, TrmH family
VRRLRRLTEKRATRWSEGACVLEGPDLVTAAIVAGAELEAVYFEPDAATDARPACATALALAADAGVRLVELREGVLAKVADAVTPQPVLGVARLPDTGLDRVPVDGFVLVLHDVRDPGNLGTAVRSADAAGAAAVVVSGQSVDVFNPKALRATAGSAFHLPIAITDELHDAVAALRTTGRRLLAAVVRGGVPLWSADLSPRTAAIVGGEAAGLGDDARALCDAEVTIAMAGRAESLNVGVAAALLCFEALRRAAGPEAARVVPPTI